MKKKYFWKILLVILFFVILFSGGIFYKIHTKKTTFSVVTIKKEKENSKVNEDQQAIIKAMKVLAKKSNFSGEVLVRRNGKIVNVMYTGYKNKEKKETVNKNTIFPICSQSKVFCGVVIAQLVREKKLSYDDKLSDYLSGVKCAEEVSIRDLLSHTSRYSNLEIAPDKFLKTEKELLKFTNSITTRIDEKVFHYSNSNFVYLALVASKVEKKSYDKIVKQRILRKLGMDHTYFPSKLKESALPVSYAVVEGDKYQPDATNYSLNLLSSLIGAGEICSTVVDMDLFFQGISSGKLLTKKEYHTLFHPNENITYSAGFSLKERNEGYRSSAGLFEGEGISSYYESDEEGDNATIILTNMHSIDIYDLGDLFYQMTSKN